MIEIKIPGKIVASGGYLVVKGHPALCITTDSYCTFRANFQQSSTFSFELVTEFNERLSYPSSEEDIKNESSKYFGLIVKTFHRIVNKTPQGSIKAFVSFDDGFFIRKGTSLVDSLKTGLGSSACLIVGTVYLLMISHRISPDKLTDICFQINRIIAPAASSCDVVSCASGSMIFQRIGDTFTYRTVDLSGIYILIGGFDLSTSTREMLKEMQGIDMNELEEVNSKITSAIPQWNKLLFKEYLIKLRKISKKVVPDRQYNALIKMFDWDILGCGTSGSGGEDCVWCAVKDKKAWDTWKNLFTYTKIMKAGNLKVEGNTLDVWNN
ncbi:Phosphomevalonate kinase [Astathelohania contejeani]|uniref:Phosphomevalonate kinase n=1 Tax=Astathelohania contejeani TaxID=164912 RepID=A0ABQ7HX41_9MICR|nr:Phosphomevalonate kinase [Thelohania contejeani]